MKHIINWYEVSSVVLEIMGDRGMNAQVLAAKADVSHNTVDKLLRGEAVQTGSLLSICDVLNVTPDLVLGYLDKKRVS